MKLNREGVQLNAEERNKRNQNWATIENESAGLSERAKELNELTNKRVDGIVIEAGTEAFNQVVSSAAIEWKEPVAAFANLTTSYPQAEEGWTSQTTEDGVVYRYDGSAWKKIQQVDAGPVNALDTRLTAQLAENTKKTDWVDVLAYEHLIPNKNIAATEAEWDWADSLQAAFDEALNTGKALKLPARTLRFTKGFGFEGIVKQPSSMPTIIGEKAMGIGTVLTGDTQDGTILLYDAVGGSALKIKDTATSNRQYFYGGMIFNLSIVKRGSYKAKDGSIGLDLKGCVDYRLYNVVSTGFDIGFKNDFGWSWDAFGLTCVHNNIGILLDDNSNACGLNGVQAHQNNIGVKIVSGTNITINRITLEGQNHGIVISGKTGVMSSGTIKISSAYAEVMSGSMFTIGKDENGISSPTTVNGVTIENANIDTTTVIPVQLDNCKDIVLSEFSYGQKVDLLSTTNKTRNVEVDNFRSQYTATHFGRYAKDSRIGIKNTQNLIPNGFLSFPDLTDFLRGGHNASFDTTTFPGEKVVKIVVPNNSTTNTSLRKIVKVDKRMIGKTLMFSGVGQKDTDIPATFKVYTPDFSGVPSAAGELPMSLGVIGFEFVCPDVEYLNIAVVLSNSTSTPKNIYIKSMVLVEQNTGTIHESANDYLSGLSGSINATTAGVVIPFIGWKSNMYEVILTPYGDFTAYVTKTDNQFTVTSKGANGSVSYLIIPKAGISS